MRTGHPLALSTLIVALGAAAPSRAESPVAPALRERGLARSGRFLVVDAERAAIEKVKASKSALASVSATSARKAEADRSARDLAQLEEQRADLQEKLGMMNQRINEQGFQQQQQSQGGTQGRPGGGGGGFSPGGGPMSQGGGPGQQGGPLAQMIAERNSVQTELSDVVASLKSARAGSPEVRDRKSLDEEARASLDAGRATLADLRRSVDEVEARYAELAADASVRGAIAETERDRANGGALKLGPSDAFKAAVKTLEQAERKLLAKKATPAPKKKARSRR